MLKNMLGKMTLLMTSLGSSAVWAHPGFHNETVHAHLGIDHFLVVLVIGIIGSLAGYYLYKR